MDHQWWHVRSTIHLITWSEQHVDNDIIIARCADSPQVVEVTHQSVYMVWERSSTTFEKEIVITTYWISPTCIKSVKARKIEETYVVGCWQFVLRPYEAYNDNFDTAFVETSLTPLGSIQAVRIIQELHCPLSWSFLISKMFIWILRLTFTRKYIVYDLESCFKKITGWKIIE